METKQYYCSQDSTIYKSNYRIAITCGIIAGLCLIFILCPLLLYWLYDWIELDLDTEVLYLILFGLGIFCTITTFSSARVIRRMANTPTLEIDDDYIKIHNHNDGSFQTIKFKHIEKFELSEFKLFGKTIRYINVIPKNDAFQRLLSNIRSKTNRTRVMNLHKNHGAVEQIYAHLIDQPLEDTFEELQICLEKYNNIKEN